MFETVATSLIFLCIVLNVSASVAQDVCVDILKQGYYDKNNTFTSEDDFRFVQAIICSDTTLTAQQAKERSLGSGGTYEAVISGFLNLSDKDSTFETRRNKFCSLNAETASSSSVFSQMSKTVSASAMAMVSECLKHAAGFAAVITPNVGLDGFLIQFHYRPPNDEGDASIIVKEIVSSPAVLTCVPTPVTKLSGDYMSCSKPPERTVEVGISTDKGGSKEYSVKGTDTVLPDLRNQLDSIWQAVARNTERQNDLGLAIKKLQAELPTIGTAGNEGQQVFKRGKGNQNIACPSGQFVSAIAATEWNSDHDDAVVGNIGVQCRKALVADTK